MARPAAEEALINAAVSSFDLDGEAAPFVVENWGDAPMVNAHTSSGRRDHQTALIELQLLMSCDWPNECFGKHEVDSSNDRK